MKTVLKCANPNCRHRIERHEILSSGKVICTDCGCRDYVLPRPDECLFPITLSQPTEVSVDFTAEELGIRARDKFVKWLADEIEKRNSNKVNFIESEQWPEDDIP